MLTAMSVSAENAIGYVCIAFVLISFFVCMAYVMVHAPPQHSSVDDEPEDRP